MTADQWVRLRATYDFVFNYTSLTLYVESSSGTASFYIDDFDLTFVPPPVAERDIASVHETLAPYFPIGAAVWQGDLAGEHAFLLKKHFNSITSENDMKWSSLQPTEGNFTFAAADAQVALAKANGCRSAVTRSSGTTRCRPGSSTTRAAPADADAGEQGPAAAAAGEPHPRRGRSLQERRLRLGRGQRGDRSGQADGFRRSPWYNITGTDYIDRAFQVAHEVAPDAKLYVNDFSTTDPAKRTFLLNLIAGLQSRGVPVDGIGHQMHNNVDFPSAEAVLETVNRFAALGSTTRSPSSTSASTATRSRGP